jgi:hypothetical protein
LIKEREGRTEMVERGVVEEESRGERKRKREVAMADGESVKLS